MDKPYTRYSNLSNVSASLPEPDAHGDKTEPARNASAAAEDVRVHQMLSTPDHPRTGLMDISLQESDAGNPRKKGTRCYKLTAMSLGVLSVILLITVMAVFIYYHGMVNNTMETLLILKAERDQLQTNYSTAVAERDQLQTNYRTVVVERDQLQTNYITAVAERDELQRRIDIIKPPCPANWSEFNSSLYFPSTEQRTWSNSRTYCIERGADLVTIEDRKEQEFLNGLMKRNHFWIGLSDRDNEGIWKWVDGTTLTSGFWKDGEPNDAYSDEDCATSEPETNPSSNWNDMPCSRSRHWVCERAVCH